MTKARTVPGGAAVTHSLSLSLPVTFTLAVLPGDKGKHTSVIRTTGGKWKD